MIRLVGTSRSAKYLRRTVAGLILSCALIAGPTAANAQDSAAKLTITPVPSNPIAGDFTFAAVGDLIFLRPMLATLERQSPGVLRIVRDADTSFGNFETSTFDLNHFKGAPQAEAGGTWMLADPRVPRDLAAMGFDLVSTANNHSADWGTEGLADTAERLDAAGLVHAGTGNSMSAARAPAYLDTPKGRVALIAATTTFTAMSVASDGLGRVPGRPGANVIRSTEIGLVSDADLGMLARIAGTKAGSPVTLSERIYRSTQNPTTPMTITYELNARDVRANLLSIRQAHQNGNFVGFSLHTHEPDNAIQTPANFAPELAHKAIDAGADMFIGHGPHQLRGIEIYHCRPIFYSLGNFAMMNNSLDDVPADMFEKYGIESGSVTSPELLQARNASEFADPNLYESVLAVSKFHDGVATEIRLYPIDLGTQAKGAARGVPHMADALTAARILARLQKLSAPFGTRIEMVGGVGVITIHAQTAGHRDGSDR